MPAREATATVLPGAAPAITVPVVMAGTLGLSAGCWAVSVWVVSVMDMGPATGLGSFGMFVAGWVVMVAAMMLPGAVPAVVRRARAGGLGTATQFTASYLGVWALLAIPVYLLYRPHGTLAAAVVVLAAGLYELTPVKRHFRRGCRDCPRSGVRFGLQCAGSSAGFMAMLVALGVMSIPWMVVTGVLALAQKLLPASAALDVPLGLALIALGCWIGLAPASVPWLTLLR